MMVTTLAFLTFLGLSAGVSWFAARQLVAKGKRQRTVMVVSGLAGGFTSLTGSVLVPGGGPDGSIGLFLAPFLALASLLVGAVIAGLVALDRRSR